MGIVTRPNKVVSGAPDFNSGDILYDSDLNGDANTIFNEFNGKISNANIDPAAAIEGSKLADLSIAAIKLMTDSVTTPKILNDAVTAAKILALAVTLAKLNISVYSHAAVINIAGEVAGVPGSTAIDTGLSDTTTQPFLAYRESLTDYTISFHLVKRTGTWKVLFVNPGSGAVAINANEFKVAYFS